jgi:hypothetical protein
LQVSLFWAFSVSGSLIIDGIKILCAPNTAIIFNVTVNEQAVTVFQELWFFCPLVWLEH